MMEKILSIVWYKVLPAVFGGQKGIALFNQHLARHVSLLCLCSRDNEIPSGLPYSVLPELPAGKWQFLHPSCWNKITRLARKERITHIILEHPYYGLAAVRACRAAGARLILHSHNIESERFRSMGKWWWWLLRPYEKWVHRQAALTLFKTEADMQWAIRHFKLGPAACILLPYGVEKPKIKNKDDAKTKLKQQYGIGSEEKLLLFAATLDYAPNARAVVDLHQELLPRLLASGFRFRLLICGRNRSKSFRFLSKLVHPSVIMAGEVEDIGLYFEAADVFINPVISGSGIQTKNLDALAHHCSVACFANMADQALVKAAGNKLFPAPAGDWEAFANRVIEASQERSVTPEAFFAAYSWEKSVSVLASRLASI